MLIREAAIISMNKPSRVIRLYLNGAHRRELKKYLKVLKVPVLKYIVQSTSTKSRCIKYKYKYQVLFWQYKYLYFVLKKYVSTVLKYKVSSLC
jgi:hypothetical protein